MPIEITIKHVDAPEGKASFFGADAVTCRYQAPGKRGFESRGAGDELPANKVMLERMMAEVLRLAFPEQAREIGRPGIPWQPPQDGGTMLLAKEEGAKDGAQA